ncbi:MAG TPA: hypothetical protein VGB37_17065, partial [Candidatus Lokiarchaeia archaeon]
VWPTNTGSTLVHVSRLTAVNYKTGTSYVLVCRTFLFFFFSLKFFNANDQRELLTLNIYNVYYVFINYKN